MGKNSDLGGLTIKKKVKSLASGDIVEGANVQINYEGVTVTPEFDSENFYVADNITLPATVIIEHDDFEYYERIIESEDDLTGSDYLTPLS